MSEQRPQSDADDMASSGAPGDTFSSNGTYPETAVSVADPADASDAPEAQLSAEPAAATVEATEAAVAESEPAAEADAPTEATESTESTAAATEAPAADDGASFLAELARAMQTTAGVERKRIEDDADRRREAHLEAIRARRESETARMRELAADDLKGIDAWAEGERQRIDEERARRAAALQEDLETSLAEHGAQIDAEIEGVEAAIAGYRAEVETFFASMERESDPVEIARHASRRPVFPDLDALAASEPEPETEAPLVGVMDREAEADPATAWSHWNEPPAEAPAATEAVADATAEAPEAAAPEPEPAASEPEPVPAAAAPRDEPSSGSLLQSVPANRPFAWLRGDRHEDR